MARSGIRRGDGYISERATKSGATRYNARWQEGGNWKSKTFGTRDEAEDHLRNVGRQKRDGRYEPESKLTVSAAMDGYLERGKTRWKANTFATYRLLIRYHVAPYIGKVRIVDLTPWRVQDWVDALVRKGLSPSVIENARVILNGVCKDAMRLGVINSNPVTGAALPARPRRKYSVWSAEDARKVIADCADDLRMFTYYTLALTTAMRPGELRALMWSDIDLDKSRVRVQRTVTRDERGRQMLGETTKTGRARTIALPATTIEALRKWRVHQNERRLAAHRWYADDLVLDRGDGGLLPQNTVARAHQRICGEAGVPIIRLHDVRHTAATLLLEAGTHIKVVSDLLGHAQIATTADIYMHVSWEVQSEATNMLADVIERNV